MWALTPCAHLRNHRNAVSYEPVASNADFTVIRVFERTLPTQMNGGTGPHLKEQLAMK